MVKTRDQISAERRQRIEERRKCLIKYPEVYQKDFDEAFKTYLAKKYPEGLDPEDCDNRFHPLLRKNFSDSPEGLELAIKYSLRWAWDPDGDDAPSPDILSPVRVIRCQDYRIGRNQIQRDSIINLGPYKVSGRFLILEIDLTYPPSEIKADIITLVDDYWKDPEISDPYHTLVKRPIPRDRDSSIKYKKMEVWKMVNNEGRNYDVEDKKILWEIAINITSQSTDSFDEKKWQREQRRNYSALINAYERDKQIYYGEPIFIGTFK
jgi:hypothetical protein